MRIAAIAAGLLLAFASVASAQTSKPAEMNWGKVVDTFARAITDGDRNALNQLLASKVVVHQFAGKDEDLAVLLARSSKGALLGAHPYIHPPETMVADIASDFKSAATVPEDIKRKMIPQDDAEMTRAKATSQQWLEKVLGAKPGQAVGVVVLWCPRETDQILGGMEPAMEPVFILLYGAEVTTYNYRIKLIVFGDPLAETK